MKKKTTRKRASTIIERDKVVGDELKSLIEFHFKKSDNAECFIDGAIIFLQNKLTISIDKNDFVNALDELEFEYDNEAFNAAVKLHWD